MTTTRTFETKDATRNRVPLLIGIVSPSGAGKTYSALRLATGIQRVTGGDIGILDTENGRGLHYADRFKYKYTPLGAPFGSLDYLAGIEHCYKQGQRTIIIDSCSHEHEGPGGHLEFHDAECKRLMAEYETTREKVQLGAWSLPKQQRARLVQSMLQIPCNYVLCFRAKVKLRVETGKPPVTRGWQPIGGEEWLFEMMMNCLLYPNACGVPTWDPREPDEREMIKLPEQFRPLLLEKYANHPLSEDIGQAMAVWAAGEAAAATDDDLQSAIASVREAQSPAALKKLAESLRSKAWTDAQRPSLNAAIEERKKSFVAGDQARTGS